MASISSTTMAIIAVAAAAGSAAYTGYQQSEAADYNQKVANQAAETAQAKAAYDENIHRERVRKLLSTQRALIGKSEIAMEGTPLLALQDTAAQGELDALAIRYGGDVEAAKSRSEGNIAKMKGKAESTSSYMKAGNSLLSGGYSAYKEYTKG